MAEYRGWLVFNLTKSVTLSVHDDHIEAYKQAKIAAEARIGETIAVFAIEEAFRASVNVGRCFVDYAPKAVEEPNEPTTPAQSQITTDAIGNPADEDGDPIL